MISTSLPTCTGVVPESITGGSAAGQDSGNRYRSRVEMKRTLGVPDLRVSGGMPPDLRTRRYTGSPVGTREVRRVVPNLYRTRRTFRAATLVAEVLLAVAATTVYGIAGAFVRTALTTNGHHADADRWVLVCALVGVALVAVWVWSAVKRYTPAVTR